VCFCGWSKENFDIDFVQYCRWMGIPFWLFCGIVLRRLSREEGLLDVERENEGVMKSIEVVVESPCTLR